VIHEFWESTIAETATVWGKLVYLASLRDENSGTYRHYALEKRFPAEECHQILQQSHRTVFYDWLGLTLEEQKDDLLEFWRNLGTDLTAVLTTWDKLEPYRLYLPAETSHGDRELFLTDLRTILDLLLADQTTSVLEPEI
jgi:hypothetical protein